ncbi:MAG: c-type cytochrome [Myxococcales bacterium]
MRNIFTFALIAGLAGAMLASAAEIDKKTERTWKAKCSSCHGADGTGATDQGKKLGVKNYTDAGFHAKATDEQLKAAILKGQGKDMPAYADLNEQADQLVALIRSFKK